MTNGKQILKNMNATPTTTEEVKLPNNNNASLPEFGRWRDVERLFGIKRGTLYNLMADGQVKSVVLRRKGYVHGCRLFNLESIRQYICCLMIDQEAGAGEPRNRPSI